MNSIPKGGYGIVSRLVMRMPGVSKEAKAVYALLCSYTGDREYCFPTVETLAADLDTSERQIIRLTEELRSKGLVEKRKFANNKRKTAYIPLIPESLTNDTEGTNKNTDDIGDINNQSNDDSDDTNIHDTNDTLILTGNTNKKDNTNTQTGAPDISPDIGRLDGLIEQYSAKVCRVDRIALDFRIRGAVAKAGIDTVEKCLRAILQAADDQDYPKDKLPRSIFSLLGDVERIDGWARRLASDPNGWAEDSEHNAKKVARMLKHSVPIPDEAKRHIPRAEKLLEARAV